MGTLVSRSANTATEVGGLKHGRSCGRTREGMWSWGQRGTQSTCFIGTKVQILTPEELRGPRSSWGQRGTQFNCFTSTKVQILTPEELREWDEEELREIFAHNTFEVLNFLALLVQTYRN